MLTDDQRARCAEMCGWELRDKGGPGELKWFFPYWISAERIERGHEPPPIETMPKEWAKLMERAMDARYRFGKDTRGYHVAHEPLPIGKTTALMLPTITADTLGECVCLAALAMEDSA